jgi:hypothetical protein
MPSNTVIVKIERIENAKIFANFSTELKKIEEKLGDKKAADVRYFYHGTRSTAPSVIYESESGFNTQYS